MMEEMDEAEFFSNLKEAVAANDTKEILTMLTTLNEFKHPENLCGIECVEDFKKIFSLNNSTVNIVAAKVVAELTKNCNQREKFTDVEIIERLFSLLEPTCSHKTNQVCRALGNIFYENQQARELVKQKDEEKIFNLLDWKHPEGFTNELESNFIKNRSGLISNYLVGNSEIAERAVKLQLIDKTKENLKLYVDNPKKYHFMLTHLLAPLSILTEMIDIVFDVPLIKLIIKIVTNTEDTEILEVCLEILQCQAEPDDFKFTLAVEGVGDVLFSLINKYKDQKGKSDEIQALVKLSTDLLIHILNGDEAIQYLYKTDFLKTTEKLLDSYDVDLLVTAVLAIGNFARTDSHCIDFVNRGIMKKLIEILAKNNGVNDDPRLQHGLLSALRNLVIPKENKKLIKSDGLIDTILSMIKTQQAPVIFKLLGTLRIAIDGQEDISMELLQNEELIKKLVEWSDSVMPGVSAEAMRLMAWLVKFAYKKKSTNGTPVEDIGVVKFVQVDGSVKALVNMLASSHLVMQNEALVALSIITLIMLSKEENKSVIEQILINSNVGEHIANFNSKNSESMTKEIIENACTLINMLESSEKISSQLHEFNVNSSMLPKLTEYCTL